MRIGIVDLDSSHPESWIPILRDLGHTIVGVFDHGDVHPAAYGRDFVVRHAAGRLFPSLEALAAEVDLAILHGCDWDAHLCRARPFVDAGRAVLIDKPMAGRASDLRQIGDWIAAGHRITGGSGLLHCAEAAALRAEAVERRWHTAAVGCGVDAFSYGIHAYSLLVAIFGAGVREVRHVGDATRHRALATWDDGRQGLVTLPESGPWLPFHASVQGVDAVRQVVVDNTRLYRAHLDAVLPYLAGRSATPPLPAATLLLPERLALAARHSQAVGGAPVSPADLADLAAVAPPDGAAYARYYRSLKYPNSA